MWRKGKMLAAAIAGLGGGAVGSTWAFSPGSWGAEEVLRPWGVEDALRSWDVEDELRSWGVGETLASWGVEETLRSWGVWDALRAWGVADALGKAPFPQQPYCVGSKCPVTAWDDNWDRLQATAGKSHRDLAGFEKNILLVRHGQYDTKGKTDEDRKLTKIGQEQMMMVAHRLALLNFPYSFVMGSQSTRGKESYSIIAHHLDVQSGFNESLNEGFPVAPVPGSASIAGNDLYYSDVMKMEYAFRSMFKRPAAGAKNSTYEILVCPANLIRYFICRALQFPPEGWLRFDIPHGSLTWITIHKDGSVYVRSIGDIGYMPPKMVTF